MKKKLLSILLVFFIGITVTAQHIKTVEGYARMEQPEDKTPAEIKAKVEEMAKMNALKDKFGSNISQKTNFIISNDNGKSTSSFYMLGESDVRGTWIRDLNKPRIEQHIEEDKIVWKAWVKGEAREVIRPKVEFKWKLLANGTDDLHQVESLHDGDAFYIKFNSPVKGYLMIFMVDDKGVVSCMLPEEEKDYCTVAANKWQLFYNVPEKPEASWIATISGNRQVEYDQLYVIFSPNKIAPPTRDINTYNSDLKQYAVDGYSYNHLPEISFRDFQKYLGKLQARDLEVQVEKMIVKISRR